MPTGSSLLTCHLQRRHRLHLNYRNNSTVKSASSARLLTLDMQSRGVSLHKMTAELSRHFKDLSTARFDVAANKGRQGLDAIRSCILFC